MMKKFLVVFLGFVTLVLVVQAAASLRWRIEHDSPLLLYLSFLMDRFGYIPYRDFFDMNMLGAFWMNLLIGRLAGYQDLGYRLVDLAMLGIILVCTFLWMRSFNRLAAWASAVLFGFLYTSWGPLVALQREYLLLLPISIGLAIYSLTGWKVWIRNLALGLAFGIASTIKPQAAIGLLPFLVFSLQETKPGRFSIPARFDWKVFLPLGLGFAIPLGAAFLYLWRENALRGFLDIARNYWPLFTQLNGDQLSLSGVERLRYLLNGMLRLRDYPIWLAPALLGLFNSQFLAALDEGQKRKARLIFWLAVCYTFSTLAGGTFWGYQWMPFGYFVLQLSSLSLLELPATLPKAARNFAPLALIIVTLLAMDLPNLDKRLAQPPPPRNGRVDLVAGFLEEHLQPGDRVQPLDWTGGGIVQAMLVARAQVATPFMNDFHFYHHLSSPYIQGLRKEFIAELKTDPPRYIISYASADKPWVRGEDTTREFNGLENFIEKNYQIVLEQDGITIYERNNQHLTYCMFDIVAYN
jgi:hypothetical protein